MKQIDISTPTYPNTFSLVDDEDYDALNKHKWSAKKGRNTFYAERCDHTVSPRVIVLMHRVIMDAPKGILVDHRDVNGLNNRKLNLRFCTNAQNVQNQQKQSNNSSGYKGVSWHKANNKWIVQIQHNKKVIYLGLFFCLMKAARCYDSKARELFGDFARLNFP